MCALSFVYILVNKRSLVFLFFLSNLFFFQGPRRDSGSAGAKKRFGYLFDTFLTTVQHQTKLQWFALF